MLVKHGTGADKSVSGVRHQSVGPLGSYMGQREAEASEAISKAMRQTRIYLAGPLFTAAEFQWNRELAEELEEMGFEVFLPQRDAERLLQERGEEVTARNLFDADVYGLYWADILVANLDGADPDSGTSWEAGKVHGFKLVLWYRTDKRRAQEELDSVTNVMLAQSGTEVILPQPSWELEPEEVAQAIYDTIKDVRASDEAAAQGG